MQTNHESTLTPEQEIFRSFCMDQVQRLSQFKDFQFMKTSAHKDYRRWLERKCQTEERVRRLMDAAVELPQMPTIAALNAIYADLFTVFKEPELTDEERQMRAEHLRDWYAREAVEAQKRRDARIQRDIATTPTSVVPVITADDIEQVLAGRKA